MPGLKFIYQVRWIGLDPTSGGEGHIPLCCTPHYEKAAVVTGTRKNVKLVLVLK
jgi:hypothetical protein